MAPTVVGPLPPLDLTDRPDRDVGEVTVANLPGVDATDGGLKVHVQNPNGDGGGGSTGGLTNTELRAAPVPVSLDLTLAALRDAITKTGATVKTLADVVAALQATLTVTGTVAVSNLPPATETGLAKEATLESLRADVANGVTINPLPAGTNNIGDVDVLTMPAVTLDAGTLTALETVSISGPVDVTPASPTADDFLPVRLTDGSAFYSAGGSSGGGLTDTELRATPVPVSGTVAVSNPTANPETGLAKDATLTGGTQKAVLRGGAKGSTTAADVTSTPVDANTQAVDVAVKGTPNVAVSNFPGTQAVSGTITANVGTTNGLALDSTLTGGTQKAVTRGGAKGSTAAADITSTAVDANTQALDVSVKNFPASQAVTLATAPVTAVTDNGGSLTVDSAQLPAALVGGRLVVDASAVAVPVTDNNTTLSVDDGAGSLTVDGTVAVSNMVAQGLTDTQLRATPVSMSGTVTANVGTTNGVALDATLTGGTQKAIARGGAKGATAAADVTTTAVDADHQALDVAVKGTVPVSGAFFQATQPVSLATAPVTPVTDNAGSLTVDTGQLPAALVSGRLSVDASAVAVPVTDNAGSLTVDGTVAVSSVSGNVDVTPASPAAGDYLPVRLTDGSAFYSASGGGGGAVDTELTTQDYDTGAGTVTTAVVGLVVPGSGAAAATPITGDATNGLDVDVTRSALPTGAATAAKQPALGTAGTASADVLTVQGIAAMTALKVDGSAATQPVSGTVAVSNMIAAVETGLAKDATLTGGTQKAIARGGAKGTTTAADVTSTAVDANTQAMDVAVKGTPSISVSNFPATQAVSLATAPVTPVTDNAGSLTIDTGQLPAALVGGRLSVDASAVAVPVTDNAGSLTVDGTVAVSGVVDVTPASPAANDYLPVRLSDGTAFYSATGGGGGTTTVKGDQPAATTGSWTSATALNTAVALTTTNYGAVTVTLTQGSTITAGAVTFEASDDGGTTWFPIAAARVNSFGVDSTYTLTASTNQMWGLSVDAMTNMRVRLSTAIAGTGTVAVRITAMAFPVEPAVSVGLMPSDRAVTATGAGAAAVTLTIPAAGAGQFHYITSLEIVLYNSAARTGVATPVVVTSTNLPGSPAWTFPSAGTLGTIDRPGPLLPSNPIKSSVANTATTIVCPATTGAIWRVNCTYFTGA